jgi:hypothetical protein
VRAHAPDLKRLRDIVEACRLAGRGRQRPAARTPSRLRIITPPRAARPSKRQARLDAAGEPVDRLGEPGDRFDGVVLAPCRHIRHAVAGDVESDARAHQIGRSLGDELLGRVVELRVVGLAVGAHERVRELVHERLDLSVGAVCGFDDDRLGLGPVVAVGA